jgi:hypothetical protein
MNKSEDNTIILLRKILALIAPKEFDPTEDTETNILLDKLSEADVFIYDVVNDFIDSIKVRDLLELHSIDEISDNYLTNLNQTTRVLKNECKSKHINIDYELEQILNNGNIIKE